MEAIISVTGPQALGIEMQHKGSVTECSMECPLLTAREQHSAHHLRGTHLLHLRTHSLCISRAIHKS